MGKILLCLVCVLSFGCTAQQLRNKSVSEDNQFNALIQEKSYFLKQYAYNPIHWLPWSEEALVQAEDKEKLIFLAIGYSSSHASHVLEKSSFRDSSIVKLINDNMLPILVDREERPDIAEYYIGFCKYFNEQACNFPLNIILLPNSKPLFVAGVLREELWEDILTRYIKLYEQVPDEAEALAQRLAGEMADFYSPKLRGGFHFRRDVNPAELFQRFERKFNRETYRPTVQSANLSTESLTFFAQYAANRNKRALSMLRTHLDKIALGGMYDHLGGGFFLRSQDPHLHFPEFEKSLLDNARKIELFAMAYHLTHHHLYEQVLYESIEAIERDFLMDNGNYLSSWDADSEGEEGRYYLWSHIEIDAELGTESELFKRTYNVEREGNWKNRENVLFRNLRDTELAYGYRISTPEFQGELEVLKDKMRQAREKRVKPEKNLQQVCSWNARLAQAYLRAYRSTGDETLLQTAKRLVAVLEAENEDFFPQLFHVQGQEHDVEFLEDYVHLASAYIDLHQASFNPRYLDKAKEITIYALSRFYSSEGFYFSFMGEDLKQAPFVSLEDGMIENANAMMCEVLLKLGILLGNENFKRTAEQLLQLSGPLILEDPHSHASWVLPLLQLQQGRQVIILKGNEPEEMRKELDEEFHPFILLDTSFPTQDWEDEFGEEAEAYFLCEGRDCLGPFESVRELRKKL